MSITETRILEYIDQNKQVLFDYLISLIGFDSQNTIHTGKELACQKFIYDSFRSLDIPAEMYTVKDVEDAESHPDFEHGRDAESRPNVTAKLTGKAINPKKLMLAAHTDTMPSGDLSEWKTDPFTGTIKDGKLIGLGVSDDKCGIAVSWFILKMFNELGVELAHDLLATAYSDEEYCGGNGSLIACLKYPCDLYINLDGGDFSIMGTALGGSIYQIEVYSNGSTDTAEPIVDALYVIRKALDKFAERCRSRLEANQFYRGTERARSAYRLLEFGCGDFGVNLDHGRLRVTVYTDREESDLQSELDSLFTTKILPYLQDHCLESSGFIHIFRFMRYVPMQENNRDITAFREIAQEFSNKPIEVLGATLSDLSIYMKYGSPNSFNFGILRDFKFEGGAHQPNESISLDEFLAMTKTLAIFAARWCEAS